MNYWPITLILLLFITRGYCQERNNSLETDVLLGISSDIPVRDNQWDLLYGIRLKYLPAFETGNELTVTAGFSRLKLSSYPYNQLSLALGYRLHFSNFFVEPQPGFIVMINDFFAFAPAIEAGILKDRFKFGIQYLRSFEGDLIGEASNQLSLNIGFLLR